MKEIEEREKYLLLKKSSEKIILNLIYVLNESTNKEYLSKIISNLINLLYKVYEENEKNN